jgi:hypothetical protein
MNSAIRNEIESYADLAFRTRRQKIDDEYQNELNAELKKLTSHGVGHNSSGREVTELRLKAEKLAKLILAKTEVLIDAYQSHRVPLDEKAILEQINSLSVQSAGGMVSGYKGEAAMRGVRTSRPDPSLPAKAQSFQRELMRRSHAAQTEAKLLIKKAKLAESHPPKPQAQVHNEYHLHGPNSRVNISSTDQSVNTVFVQADEVFAKMRTNLEAAIADATERAEVLQRLSALEEAQGTSTFSAQLGTFLAFAANWTTVITPFLPALAEIAHRSLS